MNSETATAYTAGIVDGEGCISIVRIAPKKAGNAPLHRIRVHVANTDLSLLIWLSNMWEGKVYDQMNESRAKALGRKPQWVWLLTGKAAVAFLKEIQPYLIVKSQQARTVVQFWDSREGGSGRRDEGESGDSHANAERLRHIFVPKQRSFDSVCRIIGHGSEAGGSMYCCASCAMCPLPTTCA